MKTEKQMGMTYKEYKQNEFGYTCITTFWDDFSIADRFGISAVKDTFKRAFKEWKTNYKYLTELVIVLNDKCWYYYNHNQMELSKVYSELYYQARDYALDNLKGEEYQYYYQCTD